MSRPWNLEGLMAARVLAAVDAPLAEVGFALGRTASEVDQALWALVGRTPQQALDRINGGSAETCDPVEIARGLRSLASDDDEILCEPLPSLRRFLSLAATALEQTRMETRE